MRGLIDPSGFDRCADIFPEAILLVSVDGRIVRANRSAKRHLTGCAIEYGSTLLFDCCIEDRTHIEQYLVLCGRTRELLPGALTFRMAQGPSRAFRAEGAMYGLCEEAEQKCILLRLTPKQAAVGKFLALNQQIDRLSREVERRKRTEVALVEQREWFRVTLSGIGDAVIATDVHGVITFMNPVAEAQTGWSSDEAVGKPLSEVFRIINEYTRAGVESPVEQVFREGLVVGLANHTLLIRKDGMEVPIDDAGAPIRDGTGRIIGAVLVFHDITERRRLERQIDARTAELEEEHRRKDEFLAMLGHELRNPLAPIRAALHIQDAPLSTEEMRVRARQIMSRQVDHLTKLVDDLLDVARITTRKIRLDAKLTDVSSVLHRAVELCEPLIDEKRQRLSADIPQMRLPVLGDEQRLIQVFGNLLNNASKYTPEEGAIRISATKKADTVEVAVQDNGIGISPRVLPHIFDVFSQSERALARSEGGLGVGLTIVKRLVEQHGGTVGAFSEGVDRGSEFRVVLPLATGAMEPARVATVTERAAVKRKMLVVDDNLDAAETLGVLLQLSGNDVAVATTGEEAIEKAMAFRPELIFLDLGIPGMDGLEIAKVLRSRPETAQCVLVALTGYGQDEDRRKTREAGFDHHLVKPAELPTIIALLDSLPQP